MKWSEHEKVRPVLFAPTVVHRGVGVVEERKGYTVRTSGDVDKLVPHEYECPVHGRFVVEVKASDVPDRSQCTAELDPYVDWLTAYNAAVEARDVAAAAVAANALQRLAFSRPARCGLSSYWCGSSKVGIGISSGEVAR